MSENKSDSDQKMPAADSPLSISSPLGTAYVPDPGEAASIPDAPPAPPSVPEAQPVSLPPRRPVLDWRSVLMDVLLAAVLIAGAYLRTVGLDWDTGQHLHPDERFLTMVENGIAPVSSLSEYFDTATSNLNPYNKGFGFFVYGTLPIFITRYAAEWLGQTGYDQVNLVGRALSATSDLLALFVVYLIAARLYDRRVGLLAAVFSAFTVTLIQQSHFFTVDTFANLFVVAAIYYAVRALDETGKGVYLNAPTASGSENRWLAILQPASLLNYLLFGLFFGMSVASKINTAPLALAIALAGFTVLYRAYQSDMPEARRNALLRHVVFALAAAGVVSVLTFRVGQPYAFAGPSFFSVKLNDQWKSNMAEIQGQVTGDVDFPPNHQWTARPAYIFPLQNMILWGMGIPLGVLVWLAFLWAAWQSLRGRWQRHLILVVWSGLYFAWQGGQWVKPMRYFMPIYPTLTILGAWALIELLDWARGKRVAYKPVPTELDRVDAFVRAIQESRVVRAVRESRVVRAIHELPLRPRRVAVGLVLAIIAAVVVATGAWGYAFSRIYTWPVTRVAASNWIMQNIPGPINIAIQQADGSVFNQPLPMPYDFFYPADVPYVTGFTAMRDGAVNTVTIAHLTDKTKSDQPQVFALRVASDPSGAPVLASATLTANLSHSADPRGDPVTLTLDTPVQMQKDQQYWIVGEASGTGELAIAGSTVANESSWDDGLPLRLDGFDPYGGILKGENLELYWDDNQAKVDLMQGVLDRSDYLTISSNRQYASITRLPMRYPLTIAFYRALFGCPAPAPIDRCGAELTPANFHGALGYDLVATFASDPTLGTLRINDQMAEEPFTVYDHPKVLIFKKTASYSSANIRALLGAVDLGKVVWMNPRQATSAPTVLMLPPDRLAEQRAGGTWSQMFDPNGILNSFHPLGVIVWWLTAVLLGWLVFPITFVALRGLPDRGYAVTRNVSLLLIAWAAWMLGSARLMPFTRLTLWLVTLAWGVLSAVVLWKRWDEIKAWVRANRQYILRVEGLALGLFVFFLLIRFGNSDLWHGSYGGEKPMDFSYFNAVLKSTSFPPYDPWFAGGYLNYYYFGFVIVATLTKMLGIVPSFAYNLILPMLFSLAGVGAFGVAFNLVAGGRPTSDLRPPTSHLPSPYLAGAAAALLMVVLGNLGELQVISAALTGVAADVHRWPIPFLGDLPQMAVGLWRIYVEHASIPFGTGSWYWNATRVIPDSSVQPITEFPFFTFLYADLHAHMIVLSSVMVALAWAASVVLSARDDGAGHGTRWRWIEPVALWLVGGLAFGVIAPSNLSDYQTYWMLGCVAIVYAQLRKNETIDLKYIVAVVWRCALLIGLAVLFFKPYSTWRGEGYGSVEVWKGDKTDISSYLTVHGLFVFLIVSFLIVETRRWMQKTKVDEVREWVMPGLFAVLAFVALVAELMLLGYSVAIIAAPLIAWTGLLMIRRDVEPERRAALGLMGLGLLLTLVVEIVVAKGDIGRMNTVFKFYLQVWTFFSIAGGAALAWTWAQLPEWRPVNRDVWRFALGLLVVGAASYTVLATSAKIKDRMAPDAPRTLDGMTYMNYVTYADQGQDIDLKWDYDAIRWMQDHVIGSPVIVEVNTVEYHWGSRVTINTGLPGVVGWSWHQRQQRVVTPGTLVTDRIDAINAFYSTQDPVEAMSFLKKYEVTYIVVGGYERAYFPPESLAKFAQMAASGSLKVAYKNEGTVVYEVAGK